MSGHGSEQALGKYAIQEELGRGGFATVYRAQDTVLRRDVALKILHPMLLADPAFVTRFENDARAIAQLDHPHIATIHELGQLEGRLYIAMQFLRGGTLSDRIRQQGPLPFADVVQIGGEVAEALDHAHAAGFVHRDVKPSNILFNARGQAVLTDFGMVKAAESSVIARSTMGNVIGTPAYIAPEVWEGKQDGPWTDVYALGCVLFEMLTGELLFMGATPPAVMLAHFQPHHYPEHWPDGVPQEVEALLERALARDPAGRYPSAGALAADLRALAARTADPLAEPYRALQAALASKDWARAVQLSQEIMARDADYGDVRALARQAAEGQARAAQSRQVAQWRDAALEAERSGQVDAARAAARCWLELAPGDAEAQAVLARLEGAEAHERFSTETAARGGTRQTPDAPAPRPTTVSQLSIDRGAAEPKETVAENLRVPPAINTVAAPVRSVWVPALLIAAGWAMSGVMTMATTFASAWIYLTIDLFVGGLITALVLRRAEPSLGWKHVLLIAAGWAMSGLGAVTQSALVLVTFAIGPATTALVLRSLEPALQRKQVFWMVACWPLGGVLGLVLLFMLSSVLRTITRFDLTITVITLGAIGGAVFGAIGGGGVLWQLSRARRRAEDNREL